MGSQARRHGQLLGPKPASLMVSENSTKIKKQHLSHHSPVIVHLISPKVIHVKPEEFMSLVQQLTGNPASQAHHDSNVKETRQKMENGNTVSERDEHPMEDFICSIGRAGISVDFQTLMHIVDFV